MRGAVGTKPLRNSELQRAALPEINQPLPGSDQRQAARD
jgi:hypothetical protein